ncbi:MAG: hypothetical protein IJ311_02900 [Elusimicrobiaceae bacterium]|nr:hypothetical protein [Elusimicrobiaceae bacterium]
MTYFDWIKLAVFLVGASFSLWVLHSHHVPMFSQLAPWAQYVSIFCFSFLTGYLGYGAPMANWLAFSVAVLIFGLPSIPFASRFIACIGVLVSLGCILELMTDEHLQIEEIGWIFLFFSVLLGYYLLRPFPAYGAWVALAGLLLGFCLVKIYFYNVSSYHPVAVQDTVVIFMAMPAMFFICCRGNIVCVLGCLWMLLSIFWVCTTMK